MTALFVGFTSCSDDDDDIVVKVEKSIVNLEVGEKAVVKITEGNGGYTAVPTKEEIATAEVKDSEVIISGLQLGSTSITVTDKEGKTAIITVNVVNIVGDWKFKEDISAMEVKANEETTNAIKEALINNELKSLTLNDDKTYVLSIEAEDETVSEINGTYTYVDKILTLASGEGEEIETRTFLVTEITKESTLKLKEDRTEFFQAEYPEGEVTEVIVFFELGFSKE